MIFIDSASCLKHCSNSSAIILGDLAPSHPFPMLNHWGFYDKQNLTDLSGLTEVNAILKNDHNLEFLDKDYLR